ncbi:hypothetical protein TrVE_jg9169 [Triparma verrucosa]|uniref:Glutaredoxin n=1 Tax=Triparma verrucosa TaxID=1606542 RepID=A0A9W7C4G6_9STRA|nr:hypothetical protein TrVE_jg9169 [Triparma verrucosa]
MSQFTTTASPKVLHFTAPWHPSHAQMSAVMTALPTAFPSLTFQSLPAETSPTLVNKFNVTVVPTFIFLLNDEVWSRLEGADPSELTRKVGELKEESFKLKGNNTNAAVVKEVEKEVEKEKEEGEEGGIDEELRKKIQTLLTSAPVLLLMKGTPTSPKCGFSRQTISLLQSSKIPFSSYNILENDAIRQGVKIYSDWPTYPQLYVKGELIGGLDILKDLAEDGPLSESLGVSALESIDERLSRLTKRSEVIVFMKGLPSGPKCGFSRQIVEILEDVCPKGYDSFNILEDEEVRRELKRFSEWPTYPQLWVRGELVGGLDVVREMKEEGELKELIEG